MRPIHRMGGAAVGIVALGATITLVVVWLQAGAWITGTLAFQLGWYCNDFIAAWREGSKELK